MTRPRLVRSGHPTALPSIRADEDLRLVSTPCVGGRCLDLVRAGDPDPDPGALRRWVRAVQRGAVAAAAVPAYRTGGQLLRVQRALPPSAPPGGLPRLGRRGVV